MKSPLAAWLGAAAMMAAFVALTLGARGFHEPIAATELTIVAKGMSFRIVAGGEENPVIRLAAGDRVILRFKNEDPGVDHELSIPALGVRTKTLKSGEEDRIEWIAGEPGHYQYVCTLHSAMMRGDLVVAD